MFATEKFLSLKAWKWKYYNGKIEEGLNLRSLEMFVSREMEIPNFSFAQVCSNDCVPSQHLASLFIELEYIGCHNSYSTHWFCTWLQLHSQGYSRLPYFTELTLVKIVQ